MQRAYLTQLYELAERDRNVLLLLADSGSGYDELFQRRFPDQVFDFGIAEENMVAAAAGMASCGKIPFAFTAGAFLGYRAVEFIRNDICLMRHNVKLVGMGCGLGWSTLGPTHHTTEELGLLRALPGLRVLTPSTPSVAAAAVRYAYATKGPVYIRLGMGGEPEFYPENNPSSLEEISELRTGTDAAVFTSGPVLAEVWKAAEWLNDHNLSVSVFDVCSLSPFDAGAVLQAAGQFGALISVEEHSVTGGLGSAIAETLSEAGRPVRLLRIGLEHRFASGYGTIDQLRAQNGLDGASIAQKIKHFLEVHPS